MDHLQKFITQLQNRIAMLLVLNSACIIGGYAAVSFFAPREFTQREAIATLIVLGFIAFLSIMVLSWLGAQYLSKPMRLIWQAVLHIAPDTANVAGPDLKAIGFGRELITTLVTHIYQLASTAEAIEQIAKHKRPDLKADFVANSLPLPLLVLDKDMNVLFGNEALATYLGRPAADTVGQNVYLVLDMLFSSENTFDSWLEQARADKITATQTWERVRLNIPEKKETRLFDLVAYYNKNNPEGFEIMLLLYDRTRQYGQDDQAMSLVALAVHELRTPLTLLRGYIDVFEEELDGKLNAEMNDFLHKMKAAAQQLAAFTSNVLNVSKFENDQLILKLQEEQWPPLLQSAVADMELRAKVHNVKLTLNIDQNLPTVGADPVSVYEVISNLLDNAIKYSDEAAARREVIIHSYVTSDGLVETTVQDFGPGIPESAVSNLFEKFYRDYRNRQHVGGTGMGLYLSKAIVTAMGGNIWVRSKEGEGSTFGFTLVPYAQLADERKNGNNEGADITRTAHGWIKNHSMYRR